MALSKYKELEYAEKIYADGFQTNNIPAELRLVSIYMRRVLHVRPKDLKTELLAFCENNWYGFNRALYYKIVNKAVNQGTKKGSSLVQVDKIEIYEDEFEYLKNLVVVDEEGNPATHQLECKRLMFVLLCTAKLNLKVRLQKQTQTSEEDIELLPSEFHKGNISKNSELKKSICVRPKTNVLTDIVSPLYKSELLHPVRTGLFFLDFMHHINTECKQDKVLFEITEFESLGLYYDYYTNQPKVKLCKQCSTPFFNNSPKALYCATHREYQPIVTRKMTCCDCGQTLLVSNTNRSKRCDTCKDILNKTRDHHKRIDTFE